MYDIVVRASDGRNAGELAVTVTVTPVDEGPEITGQTARTVSENYDAVLATYSATDPEDTNADITRWSISGRDGGDFRINEDGELTFRYPSNYERPADSNRDNEYLVTVRASDGRYYSTFEMIVTVTETDELPEFRSGSRTEFTYRENGTSSLYTYSATDPEGTGVTWSVSGEDGSKFEISDRGVLTFAEPPDFDVADDSDGDNEYEITVLATDEHGLPRMLAVTVAVTDVTQGPEIIGCTGITDYDAITVFENYDRPLATYSAQDPEEPTVDITRWSATGTDGRDFVIKEDGELRFRNDPDYERPADSNRNNEYLVTVRASDGHYYGYFKVTITVDPVNESPEITGTETFSYRENDTRDLATYRATDPRAPALHGRCPASTRMTWKSGTGAC